jgi:hypothetical protein
MSLWSIPIGTFTMNTISTNTVRVIRRLSHTPAGTVTSDYGNHTRVHPICSPSRVLRRSDCGSIAIDPPMTPEWKDCNAENA